jgi:nitroreductase
LIFVKAPASFAVYYDSMDLFETIYTRRAIRRFSDAAIDRNTILGLVDAAIHAPSAQDLQPWGFFVVQDRAVLNRISTAAKAHILNSASSLTKRAELKETLANPSFDIFYGAPALVVICADGTSESEAPVEDCCLAAENFMLAAHAKGLGTCWIGLATPWLSTAGAKAELGLPERWTPVAPLILGESAHLPPPPRRKEPKIIWQGAKHH